MDINFDDLDGPSKAPATKASKFAPKNSKFKPVGKPKSEPAEIVPPVAKPAVVPKVELDDSKPPPVAKTEDEKPSNTVTASADANDSVKMVSEVQDMEVDGESQQEQCQEDHVVREIDVFFTPAIDANSKLYVLQYPLRPVWRPYGEERIKEVRVKPGRPKVEIEMSPVDDPDNVDLHAEDKAMPKHILSTNWNKQLATGYAVGVLIGNKVHLNPVHAVAQLRTSLQHLNDQSSKKMNTARDDEDMIESDVRKKDATIKPPKKQNKLAGPLSEQNKDSSEHLISLKYHAAKSESSSLCRQRMVTDEACQIQFSMNPSEYINSFCPSTASDKSRSTGPSLRELLKLPLEERYKTWLLKGPPFHRFDTLKDLAPKDCDEDVLRVLRTHALLVQGLWVAKSILKLGKNEGSDVLVRDYALFLFSKNLIISEAELPELPKGLNLKSVLGEFADLGSKGWKFKATPDDSFIKQYPHVVEGQKQHLDRIGQDISERLSRYKSRKNVTDRRPTSHNTIGVTPRIKNPPPSQSMLSEETREALPKVLQKLFQNYKVCSFNQIRERLFDMAISGNSGNTLRKGSQEARVAAAAAEAPQEELLPIINQVAVNIHGAFVLKSSPEHPQYDDFRTVVINLLLAEPNAKLKKAAIYEAVKMQLKKDITSVVYQKVLGELCVSQHSAWVLKSGDGNPT